VIERLRGFVRSHWPALRLRTILLTMVAFAAFLPGASAIFLRVYENTLVRQTEAELVAQSVALAAAAEGLWPGAAASTDTRTQRRTPGYYRPEPATIDLGSTPVLPPRPMPRPGPPPDAEAVQVGDRLDPVMERTSRTTLASLLMLDRRGVIVRGPGPVGDFSALPEVRSALAGRPMTVLRRNAAYHPRYSMEWVSRASALRIHHARPIVVDGRVEGVILSSRSPRALFRGIYQDRIKILLGIIGTLGVLLVIAALVSRGIARPIAGLSRAARDVAAGSGAIPETPRTAANEIQTHYEEFRAMAEAVERRSAYLRDFAAAVSHEFMTPLAGILGAVELLQDHGEEMDSARRRRFLANIDADGRRLAALVSRLLDLARADMAQPDPGSEADFAAAARRAADAATP
jgi:HAMP domain-containing protein